METGSEDLRDQPHPPPAARGRRIAVLTAKAVVGAVLLYFVLSMVDLREVLRSLKSADVSYISLGVAFLGLNLATRILKWKLMLTAAGNRPTTWDAVASVLLGISLGSFTPGQLGEMGGRYLRVTNGKLAHVIGLTTLDRAQIFLVLAMSGLTSYSFLIFSSREVASVASVLSIGACLFLYVHLELIQKLSTKLPLKFFRSEWFKDFTESFSFLSRKQIAISLLYSLAFNLVLFSQMYFFLNAFDRVDAWTAFLGFSAMMFFKSLLPISIGDIGVREASTVYFFSLLGVSTVVALNAALMMFAVNMILPSIVGVFFLPSTRLSKPAPLEPNR